MLRELVIKKMIKIAEEVNSSELLKKQLLDESLNSNASSGMGYEKTIQAWLFSELKCEDELKSSEYVVQFERNMIDGKAKNIADIIIKNSGQLFSQRDADLIIELGHQHLFQYAPLSKKFMGDLNKWKEYNALHIQIITYIRESDSGYSPDNISLSQFDREGNVATRKASHWMNIGANNLAELAFLNNSSDFKAENIIGNTTEKFTGKSSPAIECIFKREDITWMFQVWFVISERN